MPTLSANVRNFFSPPAVQQCRALQEVIRAGLGNIDFTNREQIEQIRWQLDDAHRDALQALYRDMGIPPTPIGLWVREHAWQPLRARVWDRPQQYWRESCWPPLQRWRSRAQTRIGRSRRHGTPGDV
jgi:hypothetical protein